MEYYLKYHKNKNNYNKLKGKNKIEKLPKDILKIFFDYMQFDEKIKYIEANIFYNNTDKSVNIKNYYYYINELFFGEKLGILTCEVFIKYNCFNLLKCARQLEPPCSWSELATKYAIENGRLDILEWCIQNGCTLYPLASYNAAMYGHINILEYIKKNDLTYNWNDVELCNHAAKNGKISTLIWLREQNPPCPWNEKTCVIAAINGQLETLKWLRKQEPPCPWNNWIYFEAQRYGHNDIVKWYKTQDAQCPKN